MKRAFAPCVHLLSFQRLGEGEGTLLRLVHIYERNDASPLAAPTEVTLADHLLWPLKTLEERTMNGLLPATELPPAARARHQAQPVPGPANGWTIQLFPAEIRTFIVTFEA